MGGLRRATPADAPAIAELYRSLSADSQRMRFSCALAPESVERLAPLPEGSVCYVVEVAGRVVAEGRFIPADGTYELALTVADEYQRLGYGPRLLERLRAVAREQGIGSLRAMVRLDNAGMLRLVQRVGCAIVEPACEGSVVVDIATDGLMPAWPEHDRRPRVLVEARGMWDDEVTRVLRQEGFAVRRCLVGKGRPCPLLEQGRCRLAEGADLVACLLPEDDARAAPVAAAHARAGRLAATSPREWRESAARLVEERPAR